MYAVVQVANQEINAYTTVSPSFTWSARYPLQSYKLSAYHAEVPTLTVAKAVGSVVHCVVVLTATASGRCSVLIR